MNELKILLFTFQTVMEMPRLRVLRHCDFYHTKLTDD